MEKEYIAAGIGAVATIVAAIIGYYGGRESVQVKFESNESTYVAKLNEKDREIEKLSDQVKNLEKSLSDTESIVCAEKIPVHTNEGDYLVDVAKYFDENYFEMISSDSGQKAVSVQGKDRRNGFKFTHSAGKVSFNLDKKYKTLTFDFCHVDSAYENETDLYIYLNGRQENIIHKKSSEKPEKYTIDVTDVETIEFKWNGTGSEYALTEIKVYS